MKPRQLHHLVNGGILECNKGGNSDFQEGPHWSLLAQEEDSQLHRRHETHGPKEGSPASFIVKITYSCNYGSNYFVIVGAPGRDVRRVSGGSAGLPTSRCLHLLFLAALILCVWSS